MKKHLYSFLLFMVLSAMAGYLNPVFGQNFKYCYPTFHGGGCNGYDVAGISIVQGSNSIYSSSPSCVTTGVDTSELTGAGITLYRGKTYSITVNADGTTSFGVYIDYQHDGSYEDLGDFVEDDNNGTYSTITQSVTIPITTKAETTRMRVLTDGPNANTISPTTDCGTFSDGSSEDYKLTITAYPYDIAILAVTPEYCPNKNEPVQVIIQNVGLNTVTSIPFVFTVGSTTVSATYRRTLASNTSDTFTVGTYNASVAGTYNLKVYSNLSNDGDRTNDTISESLHIAQPQTPSVIANDLHCGPGAPYIDAKSNTPNTFTFWYATDTSSLPFAKGRDSVQAPFLPIGSSITYWVQSVFNTNDTITKGVWSTARSNYGNMFDVFAKNTVIIDSLDVNLSETAGTTDSVGVWYRVGTRSGYELSQSSWTHIANVVVKVAGPGTPTLVRLPKPVTLQTGTNYGFYTFPLSDQDVCTYDLTYASDNPLSNADMTINAGCSLGGALFSGAVTNGRDWAGRFYYHLNACPSPLVSTTLTMIQNPNGAYLAKTAPFQGKYNGGDEVHADQVCATDTNTYTIEPPTGMAQSDYGSKWTVNSVKIATVRGTVLSNATVTMPTASKAGTIQIYPSAAYGDTVFVIAVQMETPATGCDSLIQRYVTVSSNPVANFSFTNPCGNQAVVITDLSSVKSATDSVSTWLWNFGDSSTTNLTRKNPYPHLYQYTGTYQVTLSVTSTPGCPSTITKTLTEYPVPVTKFGSKLLCNTQPVAYIDSSTITKGSTVTDWNWNFGDGKTSTVQDPVHTYPLSGPYKVKLVTTSNNGCKDSLTKTERVEPLAVILPPTPPAPPWPSTIGYVDQCVGTPINFSSHIYDSSASSYSVKWNFGDGSKSTTSPHTYTANGSYTVSQYVTAGNGCMDTFTLKITPYTLPIPKITYTTACVGQPVPFVDSSGSGSNNGTAYNWTFGDGGTAANVDTPQINYAYVKAGTYTVNLTIVSGEGCTGTGSNTISIPGYPTASFTANNVCIGSETVFKNTSTGVSAPGGYTWDFGDSTSSNVPGPLHTYQYVGQDTVTLTAKNQYGCADSSSLVVSVNPLPVIAPWTQKQDSFKVTFVPSGSATGLSFVWYFGDPGDDSSTLTSPTFIYPSGRGGRYQVTLKETNSNGCTAEKSDSVFTNQYSGIEVAGASFDGITVFPNPFEGTTNINYTLPIRSNVNISVYDAEGKLVASLKNGTYAAGAYTDAFDAKKYNAAEGVYYLKMYINDKYYTTKIVNLK